MLIFLMRKAKNVNTVEENTGGRFERFKGNLSGSNSQPL